MKESITHAILFTGLLERDLARISASGNEAQQGLAADCAEHRLALANKLRHIQHIESELVELVAATNSTESRDRHEASAKAGDFNDEDDSYMRHATKSDANALAAYRRKVNRIGWVLAATAMGAVLGIGKILYDVLDWTALMR